MSTSRHTYKLLAIPYFKEVFDIIDEELKDVPEFNTLKPSLDVFKKYFLLSAKVREEQIEAKW